MGKKNKDLNFFLELLKAGLWEKRFNYKPFGVIGIDTVNSFAQEQSVSGLIAAGLDFVDGINISKEVALQYAGLAVHIEQRNIAMNEFIRTLWAIFHEHDIHVILVKGQGVAQCYEKPLWRSSGDVDLLLDENNYQRCKTLLVPLATSIEKEDSQRQHLGMCINNWIVELHGSLRTGQLRRMDKVIDTVQYETFARGQCRIWHNDKIDVLLPSPNNDIVFIFSHILQHFYGGGIGLRQVCDLCRLIWTYRIEIDVPLLEKRLSQMGMMEEWILFAALSVYYLGMPEDKMPLFIQSPQNKRKAERLLSFIIKTGNFGHNRDRSFLNKYPKIIRHFVLFLYYTYDSIQRFCICPLGSVSAWIGWITKGFSRTVTR